jgi:hypothetical protein
MCSFAARYLLNITSISSSGGIGRPVCRQAGAQKFI